MLVDDYALRSFHAQVKEKPGHTPLSTLKLLKADPAAVQAARRGDQGALFQDFQGVIEEASVADDAGRIAIIKKALPRERLLLSCRDSGGEIPPTHHSE